MNIYQVQLLLKYLAEEYDNDGYSPGDIDGLSGPATKAAVRSFQNDFGLTVDGLAGAETQKALTHAVAYGMPEKAQPEDPLSWWDDIPNFRREEFKCKCGKYCNGFPVEPKEQLVRIAQRVREHFDAPVNVSSGVRCKQHNANVGGVSNSKHLGGGAMDFSVRGFSASSVLAYVQTIPGIRYAYAIDGNYVHMDVG